MVVVTDVIKQYHRRRSSQPYDPEKLAASIYATCLSLHTPARQAELTAKMVSDNVSLWLQDKAEVTSEDLRQRAASALNALHPEAAYLYRHHNVIM